MGGHSDGGCGGNGGGSSKMSVSCVSVSGDRVCSVDGSDRVVHVGLDNVLVGALDDGGGLPVVDDGLALDGDCHGVGDRPVYVDGDRDLPDLLLDHGDVVGDVVGPLDWDGLVDHVGLLDGLDQGCVDLVGSLEGCGHGDGEVGCGGLVDLGGVAGDEVLAAEVELLGDHCGGLAVGDGGRGLLGCGVGCGDCNGGGCVGDGDCGGGDRGDGCGGGVVAGGGGGEGGGKHGREDYLEIVSNNEISQKSVLYKVYFTIREREDRERGEREEPA